MAVDPYTTDKIIEKTATIANNGTVSTAVDIRGKVVVGILFPVMTGTSVSFQFSSDGGTTYTAVYDTTDTLISWTMQSSRYYVCAPEDFAGATHIKIVSGSTEGGERSITVVTRAVY